MKTELVLRRILFVMVTLCLLLCVTPGVAMAAEECICTDKCSFSNPNPSCPHCSGAEEGSFSCRGKLDSAVSGTLSRTYGEGLDSSLYLNVTGGSGQLTVTGDVSFTTAVSGGGASLRWRDVLTGEKDVGEYTLNYSFLPDSADYRSAEGRLTYRVQPGQRSAQLTLSAQSFVYSGEPCTPAVTVTCQGMTLTEGVDYTLRYLNNTAPGTATVQLQDVAGDNYQVSGEATFTITQAPVDIGAVTYSGPRLLDSMAPGEVELSREDRSVPGALFISALKLSAGENTYSWDFIPHDPGYASVNGTILLKVDHDWGPGSCTQAPTCRGCGETDGTAPGHSLSYTASGSTITEICSTSGYEHSGTLKLELRSGVSTEYTGGAVEPLRIVYSDSWVGPRDLTVRYENNTDIGTAAGSVTVEGATASLSFEITPISMEVTARDVSVTYDGTAHTGSVTAPQGAQILYGTRAGSCSLAECPAYTDAGEYTVYYHVSKKNHATVEGSFRIRIAPVALTVTVENEGKIYGDPDPEGYGWRITSGKLVEGEGLKGITFSRAPGEDVGTYAITATDGGRNSNYAITFRDGTFTLAQREISITWGPLELIYNGSQQAPEATAGNTVGSDKLELTVSGGRTDATGGQKVTATVTGITGDKAGNYKLPANVTVRYEIKKASMEPPQAKGADESVYGKQDGVLLDVTDDMEYRRDGENTYKPITGTKVENLAPGNYFVRYAESSNCHVSRDALVIIREGKKLTVTLPENQSGYTLTASALKLGYGDDVELVFRMEEGYKKTEDFSIKVNGQALTVRPDGMYKLEDVREDLKITVEGVADDTPPDVKIWLGNRSWDSFQVRLVFNRYYNSFQTITVTAQDEGAGMDSLDYYLSDRELTMDQLKALTGWKPYTTALTIRPSGKYVIYVRAADKNGNTVYINSDGLVLDDLSPSIEGVKSRGVYYTTLKVSASDNFVLSTFKLDGGICSGTIPGNPSVETKHTLTATDGAGNSTTFTITMKPISSLEEQLPRVETLTLADREALEALKQTVSNILLRECAAATAQEKQQLEALEQRCADMLQQLEPAEQVAQLLDQLPDSLTVQPDERKYIDILDEAWKAYDALTDREKEMLGNRKDRLEALNKAMTDYRITSGDNGKWTAGESKGLTFVANGYYAPQDSYVQGAWGKFLGVEVDGRLLEQDQYTVRAGSTVVTLNTGFLETLESGQHTLRLRYTDGETQEASFRISQPITLSSGENGLNIVGILFWIALGLACLVGIVLVVLLIIWKKDKD